MSVLAYFIYAVVLFAVYIGYMLGGEFFYQYALPWLVFIAFLFAPLVWNINRQIKELNKD